MKRVKVLGRTITVDDLALVAFVWLLALGLVAIIVLVALGLKP